MQRRITIYSVILIIVIIGMWLLKEQGCLSSTPGEILYRDTSHLILTDHARCRMDCRHINRKELKEIITKGEVNYAKSGRSSKGDETYALEGYSDEHQHLRVVVSPEDDGLVVITCIDLDKEWPCNCE
jgi:Domain of unknown function (DUF4258)